uniref:Uncharacterized protein n=1 Tax=Rhodnius prolixus TaxID=13249 RepID=T1HT46_RHOPR
MEEETEVGKISINNLLKQLSVLIDSKGLARKEDIDELKICIEVLQDENKTLKSAIEELRTKNEVLENRVEAFEAYNRRNNLIFSGLDDLKGSNEEIVSKFCGDVLGVKVSTDNIENTVDIKVPGKEKRLIKATFSSNKIIWNILNNAKRLKGTGFFVNKDYSYVIRLRRQKLFQFRRDMYQKDKTKNFFIRNDILFMDNKAYIWDERGQCVREREGGYPRRMEQAERRGGNSEVLPAFTASTSSHTTAADKKKINVD